MRYTKQINLSAGENIIQTNIKREPFNVFILHDGYDITHNVGIILKMSSGVCFVYIYSDALNDVTLKILY